LEEEEGAWDFQTLSGSFCEKYHHLNDVMVLMLKETEELGEPERKTGER
jgi:hypothetical protein